MITIKLRTYFLVTSLLLVAHMLEEWFSGFPDVFPFMIWLGQQFQSTSGAAFFIFMLMSWLLLLVSLVFLSEKKKWILWMLSIFSIIYLFELHHPVRALLLGHYYPGAVTGLLFPFVGIFFWKELRNNFNKSKISR